MSELISIIVPVYNCEKYINRCIDSILNQSFSDFELILIDNGSKDGSPEICDNYMKIDDRIRVFHIPNAGVSNARNTGIDNAKGSFIAFVDADDYLEKDYLKVLYSNSAEGYKYPVCQVYCVNETGLKKIFFEPNFVEFKSIADFSNENLIIDKNDVLTLNANQGWACRSLFNKDILNKYKIRFNERIRMMEDKLFVMDYINHINPKDVEYISHPLYNYVKNPQGTVNSYKKDYYLERKNYLKELKRIYNESNIDEEKKALALEQETESSYWSIIIQEKINSYKKYKINITTSHVGFVNDLKIFLKNTSIKISEKHKIIYKLLICHQYFIVYLILKLHNNINH